MSPAPNARRPSTATNRDARAQPCAGSSAACRASTWIRATIVGRAGGGAPDAVTFAVVDDGAFTTAHLALPPGPAGEVTRVLADGRPGLLALTAPGTSFVWARFDPAAIKAFGATALGPFASALDATTGEVLAGALADPSIPVVLAGVTDPAAVAGLLGGLESLRGAIPPSLPDGSKIDLRTETVEAGGRTFPVAHLVLTPGTPEMKEMAKLLGMKTEAVAFAAGELATLAFGIGPELVETIATSHPGTPAPEVLAPLPPDLAKALHDGTAPAALHLALDVMQSPVFRAAMDRMVASMPADEAGLAPEITRSSFDLLAPLSSMSLWATRDAASSFALHLSIGLAADPAAPEAGAVASAIHDVAAGGSPEAVYGALATAHPDSSRADAWRARAGANPGSLASAMSTSFLAGMMAAIAIPSLDRYIERSKQAAGG